MKITMKDHMEKYRINGTIVFRAVHAKYLSRAKEVPDPFLRFLLPNKEKRETKEKKGTSFPEWNERVECPIDMSRNDAGFVDVEVIDSNTFSNTTIGRFVVDVDPCYSKPNEWEVNKVFEVLPPTDKPSSLR